MLPTLGQPDVCTYSMQDAGQMARPPHLQAGTSKVLTLDQPEVCTYSMQGLFYRVQYAMFIVHSTVCNVFHTVCSVYCTVYSIQLASCFNDLIPYKGDISERRDKWT